MCILKFLLWKYLATSSIFPGCIRVVLPPKLIDSQWLASTRLLTLLVCIITRYIHDGRFGGMGYLLRPDMWHLSILSDVEFKREGYTTLMELTDVQVIPIFQHFFHFFSSLSCSTSISLEIFKNWTLLFSSWENVHRVWIVVMVSLHFLCFL
jgi:hypothetical protein